MFNFFLELFIIVVAVIVKMLEGIRKEGKRAIVYDTAGTFVEK